PCCKNGNFQQLSFFSFFVLSPHNFRLWLLSHLPLDPLGIPETLRLQLGSKRGKQGPNGWAKYGV
ncbi:hypothetical protein LINPERHAP1_LOCUS38453, partial [Linum perenne]